MIYKTILFVFFNFLLFLNGCIAPKKSFESYTPPKAPDYSLEQHWAALPSKRDSADVVPQNAGLKDEQALASADVFFIHPTSYLKKKSWNADVDDKKVNKRTDKGSIKHQASVFNGSCKVYAPRYRQATFYSFIDKNGNGQKALELAYQDVKKAFEYYLNHYNQGRPIVIASHSQGTRHGFRLVKELIEGDAALRDRLVCAYLVGLTDTLVFSNVPPCASPTQIGCMVSWRTARWGKLPDDGFFMPTSFCTNPLSWTSDEQPVDRTANLGGVPFNLTRIDVGIVGAKNNQQILWVTKPQKRGYLKQLKNYHIIDYNLFYVNIRENVKIRLGEYWKTRP